MDYKAVLEEQIRELQKVQDQLGESSALASAESACLVAKTIAELIAQVQVY